MQSFHAAPESRTGRFGNLKPQTTKRRCGSFGWFLLKWIYSNFPTKCEHFAASDVICAVSDGRRGRPTRLPPAGPAADDAPLGNALPARERNGFRHVTPAAPDFGRRGKYSAKIVPASSDSANSLPKNAAKAGCFQIDFIGCASGARKMRKMICRRAR
jgi:hypothetical protein